MVHVFAFLSGAGAGASYFLAAWSAGFRLTEWDAGN